jgi:hypothetical protein
MCWRSAWSNRKLPAGRARYAPCLQVHRDDLIAVRQRDVGARPSAVDDNPYGMRQRRADADLRDLRGARHVGDRAACWARAPAGGGTGITRTNRACPHELDQLNTSTSSPCAPGSLN